MLTIVIVTLGLALIFNGASAWIWGAQVRSFESPFSTRPIHVGGVAFSIQDIGIIVVCFVLVGLLALLFRFTKVGLALRASAVNPEESRLVGIRVGWMLALGWGLAAVLGAVSGMMAAPIVFLDPNMMVPILLYAFAAAILGGLDSPVGAVVGGLRLRRTAEPRERVLGLRRRRAQAAVRTGGHPRRAPRPADGHVRPPERAQGMRYASRLALLAVLIGVGLLLPRVVSDFRLVQFATVGIYFIAILGLNFLTGYSGQISLGHGAFMAIGGYTSAILIVHHGWSDLATIPVAGLVAGVAGLLFGIPALRLSGLYLALATFSLAVSMPSIIKKWESETGGSSGLLVNVFHTNRWYYTVTWITAAILFVLGWLLLETKFSRAWRAIRDSEIAAASMGIDLAALQDVGVRHFGAVRGRCRRAARHPLLRREPGELPDPALDLPRRRVGRVRSRAARSGGCSSARRSSNTCRCGHPSSRSRPVCPPSCSAWRSSS